MPLFISAGKSYIMLCKSLDDAHACWGLQEELPAADVAAACQGGLIRLGAQLRAALLSGRAARRLDLLGNACSFGSLQRASSSGTATEYVLELT